MLANPFSERCAFVQGACRSSRIESKLATAAPLHDLGPLVLGELVEDAVCELALRALISPVVEGTDLGSVFVELPPQQVVIGGLAGEAVPILCQHHIDTTTGYQVPHTVHTGPLKAGAALSGVRYLFEDLVALSRGVLP